MKTLFQKVLLALLAGPAFAQVTSRADLFTSTTNLSGVTVGAQNRTTAGNGNQTLIKAGAAAGANTGGSVVITPGTGAPSGQVQLTKLLRFLGPVDSESGHIRNGSNTPIVVVDQSNQSAFVGAFAGTFASGSYIGNQNTGLGNQVLTNLTSGSSNTAIGYQAMQPWTDGSDNTAVGAAALSTSSSGNQNVAIGAQAMNNAGNSAAQNVAVGRQAGFAAEGGESTFIGHRTGQDGNPATTASGVTFLGARAGLASATQHDFLTAVGYDAKGECDNCVILGRVGDATGIGLLDPPSTSKLHVNGNFRIGTSASYVGFNVATPTSYDVTLPQVAPTAGQVLTASNPTTLTWSTPTGAVSPEVPLTVDDQIVDVAGFSTVIIASDDPVAANRTFTITNPAQGQQITFVSISSDQAELLDDSVIASSGGLIRLSGDWFPSLNSTLTVVCNDASGLMECYETSRSSN